MRSRSDPRILGCAAFLAAGMACAAWLYATLLDPPDLAPLSIERADFDDGEGIAFVRHDPIVSKPFVELELPASEELSPEVRAIAFSPPLLGRVLIDGKPPAESVQLKVDDALRQNSYWASTDERGDFVFAELPADFGGTLELPDYFRLAIRDDAEASTRRRIAIESPFSFLELQVEELTAIRGRLISTSRSVNVAQAKVRACSMFDEFGEVEPDKAVAKGGQFSVVVAPEARTLSLAVVDGRGIVLRSMEIHGPFRGVRKIGDVDVDSPREVEIHVRDTLGRTVSGAIAMLSGTSSASPPTNADGFTKLPVHPGSGTARVGRLGYGIVEIAVPDRPAGPIEAILPPGNQLTIKVHMGDGSVDPSDLVHVRMSATAFKNASDPLLEKSGATPPSPYRWNHFNPCPDGTVTLGNLATESEIIVELVGNAMDVVLDEQRLTMESTTSRTVTLQCPKPRDFEGIATLEDGTPVSDRYALIDGYPDAIAATDASGAFRLRSVFLPTISVVVKRFGGRGPFKSEPLSVFGSDDPVKVVVKEFTPPPIESEGEVFEIPR
jgi:hypothetical protein